MSDRPNQVFRPDITDYGMPPQNRLAQFLPYGAPQVWPASNPVGTETTQSMQSATPTDQIAFMRPDGTPVMQSDLAAAHQQVQQAMQTAPTMVLGMEGGAPGIRAFHGSPADFSRFDDRFIGTGEGAQAYGRGHYFGGVESTGLSYRDALTAKQPSPELIAAQNAYNKAYNAVGDVTGGSQQEFNAAIAARDAARENMERVKAEWEAQPKPQGHMYEVNIAADPEQFLHWDKLLSEQSPQVQKLFPLDDQGRALLPNGERGDPAKLRGQSLYNSVVEASRGDHGAATQSMADAGIPGIRYLDQGSRGAGEGTHNYVVFDANTIDILRKYGLAGLGIGLGATAAGTQQQSQ